MSIEADYPAPHIDRAHHLDRELVVTKTQLVDDLRHLGIDEGNTVCVHSSCGSIGYVVGGSRVVLDALLETVAPGGTIMMPTFTGDLSDPAEWQYPSIPVDMVEEVRESLPGYNRRLSPSRKMGILPELLRNRPGAVRSLHPQSSFTALGRQAQELCGEHPFDYRFGPNSPLGALARLNGKVLMLGSPWNTASIFYLTEFSMEARVECRRSAPIEDEGSVHWVEYRDLIYSQHGHEAIIHLLAKGLALRGKVGNADAVVFYGGSAVEETSQWRKSLA